MRAFLDRLRPYAPLALRVMLGVMAISFSMGKVFHGMSGFRADVAAWGMKPWVAPAVAWGSLAGGFLLILGLGTRLAALVLIAVTTLLIVKTKLHAGFSGGLDFPILTIAALLSLVLGGPGRPSLDAKILGG